MTCVESHMIMTSVAQNINHSSPNNIFLVLISLSNILANFVYTSLSEINGSSVFPNRQEICRGSIPTERLLVAIFGLVVFRALVHAIQALSNMVLRPQD
jgi:hypothetical protein